VSWADGIAAYTSNGTVDIMILKCTVMTVLDGSTIRVQLTMSVFSPPGWEGARDTVTPEEAVRILKRV
jgi:hypothetical protein